MSRWSEFIFEWLSPQGVMAAGILWTVVQGIVTSYRAAMAVKVLAATTAESHAVSLGNAAKLDKVAVVLDKVIDQTNGMSHRLETLASEAGVARGREVERDAEAARQATKDST